ncbi:selenoprotein B glycine/betaine/sarcosine/D-proline reductase [Candidatus Entotheonella serta]|nr:selenoprotein B glycine/betaine/sarcosine/D-proline reductase [Candidatus Entotheonella serta]
MVRLIDLPDYEREHLLSKSFPPFQTQPWVTGPALAERRVALVTSAGLHRRDDAHFSRRSGDYRILPGNLEGHELIMSQGSVNFDRTGFQQAINVVFPIDRMRELVRDGTIGSLADYHYSFMGAGIDPYAIEATARQVAGRLKDDGVNAVFLTPV